MFLPTNITLKFGDSGDFVAELQRRLSLINCFNPDAINGFFDNITVNGVSQFQTMTGIRADGIAGPETLRRLNGAISGDNSSTTDHKAEEEARLKQEQAYQLQVQQQMLMEQQRQAEQLAQQQAALQAQTASVATQVAEPYAPAAPQPQAYAATQPIPSTPAPVAAAPNPLDMLAQIALQAQASQPPAVHQQPHTPPLQKQPQYSAPMQQQAAAVPSPSPQPQTYTTPVNNEYAPAEQPRGIVGRAMQYANEMVQKLANYFESKLPSHVIQEVKAIGHSMANSGVKEVPIPTGPEQQKDRGIEQGRGQGQGMQRG